jgi:hypothetical protein
VNNDVHRRARLACDAITKAIKETGWAGSDLWAAYDVARLDCIAESYRAYLPKVSERATFQRGSRVTSEERW